MSQENINQPWWKNAVIYQIYPRSFFDSTGTGVGDLKGIIKKFDYIVSLGVDAIWISPFFKSPMKDYGYDISNYEDVDPLFGNLKDFKKLVTQAHDRGLKVIIDQVISHTSDQHPWFKESRKNHKNPKADWYVWTDAKPDGTPCNNWLSIFGGSAWQWDAHRQQYFLHNFLKEQPDLNFHNPQVRKAILSSMEFWLRLKVDGFRLDTVNFYYHSKTLKNNPPNASHISFDVPASNPYSFQKHYYDKTQPENLFFLTDIRKLLNRYSTPHHEIVTIGEVGDDRDIEIIAEYTKGNNRLHTCYGFSYLSNFFSVSYFKDKINEFEKTIKDGWACWSFSNHDVKRVTSRWGELVPHIKGSQKKDFSKMLLAVEISLKGMVCIYQGEELGLNEADIPFEKLQDPYGIEMYPDFKGRDGCRTPMVWEKDHLHGGFSSAPQTWLPVPKEHLKLAVDQQEKDAKSVLNFTRALLKFKKSQPLLTEGIKVVSNKKMLQSSILGLARGNQEKIILFANFSAMTKTVDLKPLVNLIDKESLLFFNQARFQGQQLTLNAFGFSFIKTTKQ